MPPKDVPVPVVTLDDVPVPVVTLDDVPVPVVTLDDDDVIVIEEVPAKSPEWVWAWKDPRLPAVNDDGLAIDQEYDDLDTEAPVPGSLFDLEQELEVDEPLTKYLFDSPHSILNHSMYVRGPSSRRGAGSLQDLKDYITSKLCDKFGDSLGVRAANYHLPRVKSSLDIEALRRFVHMLDKDCRILLEPVDFGVNYSYNRNVISVLTGMILNMMAASGEMNRAYHKLMNLYIELGFPKLNLTKVAFNGLIHDRLHANLMNLFSVLYTNK